MGPVEEYQNRSGLMTQGNMIILSGDVYSVLQYLAIVDPANFTLSTCLNHYNYLHSW